MRILAVDPGNEQSAYLMWDMEERNIICKGIEKNEKIRGHLKTWSYDVLVIEMTACMGMAVGASVLRTTVWIGRFEECSLSSGVPFAEIFRHQVKMHLCGNMRAKDSNIRQALIDRFGPLGRKKEPGFLYGVKKEIWQALALAICYYDWKGKKHR